MKIEELHIYGFGKLENVTITDMERFQVFYGENEAGKSTIMAFIHGVLFGFPAKHQPELRYEPKGGGKYGGRIKISHPVSGRAVIERIRGKSAGDVTITFEDGTAGGEELLRNFLGNFDRSLFQAIFSFNIHGLQNVHHLKNDEIGRFMFSSGTLGTDRLTRAEIELQKELEALYKPSGKKPVLNSKLANLRSLEASLSKAAEKNGQYERLIEEKEAILKEIKDLEEELPGLALEINKLKEWAKIGDMAREEASLSEDLGSVGEIPFPARGIDRLDACKKLLEPLLVRMESLKKRKGILADELEAIQNNMSLLDREAEISSLIQQLPSYEQAKLESRELEDRLARLEETIAIIKGKLHLELHEDEIIGINTDIYIKQHAEAADDARKRLASVKQQLDANFHDEKAGLEQLEGELEKEKALLLPEDERTRLEKHAAEADHKHLLEECRERIRFLEEASRQEMLMHKRGRNSGLAVLVIGLALLVYGMVMKQWGLAGIGSASMILGIFFGKGFAKPNPASAGQELTRQKEREKELEAALKSRSRSEGEDAARLLEKEGIQREKVKRLAARLEQQNIQYEKIISSFEQWEKEEAQLRKEIQSLCTILGISEQIGNNMPAEAFRHIEECKNAVREKKRLQVKIASLKQFQADIEEKAGKLQHLLGAEAARGLHLFGHLAKAALDEEKKKLVIKQEKSLKLEEIDLDLEQLALECSLHDQEARSLLEQAGVSSEEEFYRIGELARKQEAKQIRLTELERELSYSLLDKQGREKYLPVRNALEMAGELEQKTAAGKARIGGLQERLAGIRIEIKKLEEGGTYSELLHQFRLAKSDFEEEAKEWAVRQLARELLKRTTDRFKEFHLPRMLRKAEEYLGFLTEGSYCKLFLAPSGTGFLIERDDHTLFEANELSQATAEQVYVSLRLALAETIYEKTSFPLIIDDSFVNFDEGRVKRMMRLLAKMETRQVLFFTCHSHLLKLFNDTQIHHLGKSPANIQG